MKQVRDSDFRSGSVPEGCPGHENAGVREISVLSGERLCEKTKQYVTFINDMDCLCKKFRKNQKIDGDIVHTGRENFVCSILI